MKTALDMDKTYTEPTNDYERNIRDAARKVIYMDKWNWHYVTQYASGATIWRLGDKSILIKAEPVPGSVK
jgi:hypothetical protein